jgi:hypothetical protein
LADIPNDNPYHGNGHFRKVTALNILFADVQLNYYGGQYPGHANFEAIAIQGMIGAIHDIYHDGQSNTVNGTHIPARLEKISAAKAAPYLAAAGIDPHLWAGIEAAVLGTDCSGSPSPQSTVHDMYRHQHDTAYMKSLDFSNFDPEIAGAMEFLRDHPVFLHHAMMMCECDLVPSAGVSVQGFLNEGLRLHIENPISFTIPNPKSLTGFFNFVVKEFQTPVAKRFTQDAYDDLKKIIAQSAANNNTIPFRPKRP